MRKQDFQSDHLKQLPLRAIVAFSVRCARRVQPLSELPEGHPGRERLRDDVEAALRMAEEFAAGSRAPSADSVVKALDVSRRVPDVPLSAEAAVAAVSEAAHAAASAWHLTESAEAEADEARKAHASSKGGGGSRIAADIAALDAFTAAVEAYQAVGLHNENFVAAALGDYDRLLSLRLGRYPDAGDPIDPSPRGPLGPF